MVLAKTRTPRPGGSGGFAVGTNAPHSQSSSPGLTGRSSIPKTPVMESKGRGVLDASKCCGGPALSEVDACCVADANARQQGKAGGGGASWTHEGGSVFRERAGRS